MRRKVRLVDKLKQKIEWDEDSKKEHWDDFYIPFYKNKYQNILEFDELTYSCSNNIYRVVAKVIKGISGFSFGGDVIINLSNVPKEYAEFLDLNDKYSNCNLAILPQQGNLQGGKKKAGNDWRIDKFIKVINDYYCKKNIKILELTKNRKNQQNTIEVLNFLSCYIYGGEINEAKTNEEKIYNFCRNIYGISDNLIVQLLEPDIIDTPQKWSNLINEFWIERKLNHE